MPVGGLLDAPATCDECGQDLAGLHFEGCSWWSAERPAYVVTFEAVGGATSKPREWVGSLGGLWTSAEQYRGRTLLDY